MKKILITGGAGFIGRHLVEKLLDDGCFVTTIDNEYRWKTSFLDHFVQNSDFKSIKGDITDEKLIRELIRENDIVVHLAGVSQVMISIQNPEKTFLYNAYGTYLISKYCSKFGKKLIFSSSREVYGSAEYLPVDLKHKINPENPYAASKVGSENFITNDGNYLGLHYVIFRISNVYGHGDKGRAVPIFMERALKGEDLVLFGADKIIDFIYIDDVISAFVAAIDDRADRKILNLGSGKSTTIKDLAKLIVDITNSGSKIVTMSEREGEVDKFTADIGHTKNILKGWSPEINLKEGLEKIIEKGATNF